jgi:TonB-linked SusC/RagA family outer membrane protein
MVYDALLRSVGGLQQVDQILANIPIEFTANFRFHQNYCLMRKCYGLTIVLTLLCFHLTFAQTQKISGKITDAKTGAPLPGATISTEKNGVAVRADAEGAFVIEVPAATKNLVITSVGYRKTIAPVKGNTLNINLEIEGTLIDEVVVTGYTTVQRKKFAGASAVISSADVRRQPMASFDQALQGQAAGVSVIANSGQPGMNAMVRIRGNGSINGNNAPLYIMDGIEISAADFASVNQGDFERIEVLKDAVATAAYGSRGANGVLVITTRRGKASQLQLNYDGQLGFSQLPKDRLELMNSQQKIDYELQRGNPFGWTPAQADSLRKVNFNWRDALFRSGVTHQHQISASGGSQNSRFFGSLSYLDQEGILRTTGLKRYTVRVNVDNNVKNWRFGISLQGGYSKLNPTGEGVTTTNSPLNAIRWGNPYERDIDPRTGEYQETGGAGTGQFTSGQPNGAMELFLNHNTSLQLKGIGVAYLEYHMPFVKGMFIRTNWGVDYGQTEGEVFTSPRVSAGRARQGALNRNFARNLRYTGTTSLNYKTEFGKHEIDGGLFFELVKNRSRNFGFLGFGFTNGFENETGITAGSVTNPNYIPQLAGGGGESGLQSYFALVNYGYDNKYYLNLVGRRDGSSRFGFNNRYGNFGSVGLTWVLSNEDFLRNVELVNELKVRLSIGTNGNNASANYALPLFARSSYAGISGWGISSPGNLDLRWETNRTINLGVDFALLKQRISGTVELYDRQTQNLFYGIPIDPSLNGFATIDGNFGKLRNRGVELTLRGDVIQTKNFRWTVDANITYNQNRVLELKRDSTVVGLTILAKGRPINSLYLVEYAGVDPNTGNALYNKLDKSTTPTFNTNDKVILGTSDAPWFGGINTSVSFKGIELSAQLNFFLNRYMYNNDRTNVTNPTYFVDNMVVDVLREWKQAGDKTDVPRPTSTGGNAFQTQTTRFMENASFWRLRNVTLAYNLPSAWLNAAKLRSARVFVQGQNWWTSTEFRSFDPEMVGTSLTGAQYPALIQTTVGLSIGF